MGKVSNSLYKVLVASFVATALLSVYSCSKNKSSQEEPQGEPKSQDTENALGIPEDSQADAAPRVTANTFVFPNCIINPCLKENCNYIQINIPGIYDEDRNEYLPLYATGSPGQNVWVDIDADHKGVGVSRLNSKDLGPVPVDIVFLVDNSLTMGEEADIIASCLPDWARMMEGKGFDIRVGCVGYGYGNHAVNGGCNLTSSALLTDWLELATGNQRTQSFAGEDAGRLGEMAEGGEYENGQSNECGIIAIRFAHDNFSFRRNAMRIYVNFTDEPNQPYGYEKWSVEFLNPSNRNWKSFYGTVFTVYSGSLLTHNDWLYEEKPWLMSEYTGGITDFVNPDATGWTLSNLHFTQAVLNCYALKVANIDKYKDGEEHEIRITFCSSDRLIGSVKKIPYNFSKNEEGSYAFPGHRL